MYPRNIDEALELSLDQLAPCGEFMGCMISEIDNDADDTIVDQVLTGQLKHNKDDYVHFNISSLGSLARIIVSGKNDRIIERAQEIYDGYKKWRKERYYAETWLNELKKFLQPIFISK